MQWSLSPALERAMLVAQGIARAQQAAQVHALHLLHALMTEEDSQAANLAREAGLNLADFARPQADGPDLPWASDLEASLYQARELAQNWGDPWGGEQVITSESVFLALARSPELSELLRQSGLQERLLPLPTPAPEPEIHAIALADLTEQVDLARVLDASANRAREALRVLEDHARFVLDDALLCAQFKELRHELSRLLNEYGPPELPRCRDTLGDVGTAVGTESEYRRDSLQAVWMAATRRLAESLRSLEEYAKVASPQLGQQVESLRYRTYTLEKALLHLQTAQQRLAGVSLYLLLSAANTASSLEWTIAEAAQGGVGMVQLREKHLCDRELLQRAREVRRWTRLAGILFIVNDRPDIARLVEADGVHLGQDDLPVREARRLLGPDAIIGLSTHDLDQVRQAVAQGVSYIGLGPTFPSRTKAFDSFAGLEFIRQATTLTQIPAFAIGGITPENAHEVVAAGARRVAVSQAIAAAEEPRKVAEAFCRILRGQAATIGG
ncbi:MAG: thiamine phosphate synthase [Gemmataceae bacterium]